MMLIFNSCTGDVVSDGYVILTYDKKTFIESVTDGGFEINLLRCEEQHSFSIEGIDYDTGQTTGNINYTFTTPLTDLGTINSCDTISEFVQYTIDDGDMEIFYSEIETSFNSVDDNVDGKPSLTIYCGSDNGNSCFYLQMVLNESPYIGTYTNTSGIGSTIGFWMAECISMAENNNNVLLNVTTLSDLGDYIDINFAGNYEDTNGNAHTISGVIHVIR